VYRQSPFRPGICVCPATITYTCRTHGAYAAIDRSDARSSPARESKEHRRDPFSVAAAQQEIAMRHDLTFEREWQAKTRRQKGVPASSAGAQTNKQTHKKGTRQRESDGTAKKQNAQRNGMDRPLRVDA
jgi:hypothetical protein